MGPHPPYIPGLETCELRAPPPTSLARKLANPFGKKLHLENPRKVSYFCLAKVFAVKLDVKHSEPAVVVRYGGAPTATCTEPPQIAL